MILQGIDLLTVALLVSSVHTEDEIGRTVEAFDLSISMMKQEGIV